MQLRYNFRVHPTPGQREALAKAFGCAHSKLPASAALQGRIPALQGGEGVNLIGMDEGGPG